MSCEIRRVDHWSNGCIRVDDDVKRHLGREVVS